eukprot:952-Eustigmatos_ZCMA.PRE.1
MCPACASGVPLVVMVITVAPWRRAMSAASMRSRVRPEFETITRQSPARSSEAPITCMWPSL